MPIADVVVVGAGPAGTAAAADLAARGFHVVLVDRATFPRDKPCGDYCNPGAAQLLDEIGMLRQVLEAGAGAIDAMTVVAQDGSSFTERFPIGQGLLIRRERLDALLVHRAARAGAEIVEGYCAETVTVNGHVEIRSRHRTAFRGRLLIAADGMRSVVARRLGLLTTVPMGRYTVGAYFSGCSGPAAGELHLGPSSYGGVARFGDGTANVCLALPRGWFPGRSAADVFAAGLRRLPALSERVAGWTREGAFRVSGPVGVSRHEVVTDRAMLAGDAAGQVEPVTGQGISFALRSGLLAAEEAARALKAGTFSADALAAYARRRSAALGPRLRLMNIVTHLALRPRLTPALVRRLARTPGLARRLLGSTGDVLSAEEAFSPKYAIQVLLGIDAHDA
ncbi:MAG TPA: FAD-dependent oxidoreductase [bacterium]|nr:FAD-dependent oxidoreductase [bacterium]